jgi:acyl phosphate:glycerol-3-phosphate acyltransferase
MTQTTMQAWMVFLAAGGAYLLGSIPPGLFWSKLARGIDVRKHGSGRTGGTNVWRSAGFLPALMTAISDGLKGAAAIWLARALGLSPWWMAAVGALAIVGHNYSLFLSFRGGAGTATSLGIAAVLWLPSLPALILAGVMAGLLVGHASVASISVAFLLPTLFLLRGDVASAVAFALPTMVLTIWALRPNIVRLWKGKERFLPIYRNKPPLIRLSEHPQGEG